MEKFYINVFIILLIFKKWPPLEIRDITTSGSLGPQIAVIGP